MTTTTDNFACLLTPAGTAAIAVVRLAGPGVPAFCAAHLSKPPRRGRCVHVELSDNGRVIDDPVVVLNDDSTIDLCLHGGRYVVEAVLELAARTGFTPLSPADAPPALIFDTADPIEGEMLAALPAARTEAAVRILLAQPGAWAAMLRERDPAAVKAALLDRALPHLLSQPAVAIVGVANVGKSTLANRLFGQDRSITADHPGTTRDWVGESADVGGLIVTLIDTPGQRPSDDPIEQRAIANARGVIAGAALRVVVLDVTQPLAPQRALVTADAMVCLNKIDAPAAWPATAIDRGDAVHISAATSEGVDELRRRVLRHFGCDDLTPSRPRAWTARQQTMLERI
ncbi:MAG TPA: GTPase [Tepidisphaeraceae bacterium]|jgi:tRNA modification GTPase